MYKYFTILLLSFLINKVECKVVDVLFRKEVYFHNNLHAKSYLNNNKTIFNTLINSVYINNTISMKYSNNEVIKLSQSFVYATKTKVNIDTFIHQFSAISMEKLKEGLVNDNEKIAFWINVYNGFVQYFLHLNPTLYEKKTSFFSIKSINIAGSFFSLDDIEHGILRHSKIKWSFGYLNKLFPSKKERMLRVTSLNYRIHFALNCGAKSCPTIAFYDEEKLNNQLNLAAKIYLQSEVAYDSVRNKVLLPKIMFWFCRDFGKKNKVYEILSFHQLIPITTKPKISYKKYNWELDANNFREEN